MRKNKLILTTILILIVAGIAGFFIRRNNLGAKPPSDGEQTVVAQPLETNKNPIASGEKPKGPTQLELLAKRALDRQIPEGEARFTSQLKDLSAQLSREPNYLQGWLQVGILRKVLGDYDGAILAWQYASLIRPNNYIAFNNLADLYYYYLKDFPKAEAALLDGISKNTKNLNLLTFLASLYQDQGDKPNARKYYEEALKLNPQNKDAIEQALKEL